MNIKRALAKVAGDTRYFGDVCEKHPEVHGERKTCNNKCIACYRLEDIARTKAIRKTLGKMINAVAGTRKEAIDGKISKYIGSICEKHPEIGGVRSTKNGRCVRCLSRGKKAVA